MRGTHVFVDSRYIARGIIPAYAGNTLDSVGVGIENRDHPRVCGEHRSTSSSWMLVSGSSPRMRGTHMM